MTTSLGKKPPLKERKKSFEIHPFGYMVHVIVTDDIRRSASNIPTEEPISVTVNASAFTVIHKGNSNVYLVLPTGCGVESIAHESFHAINFILRDVGVKFEEEVWAYHLGELVETVAKFAYKNIWKKAA